MIQDLKQFVPSEVCMACDGCCRFKEEKSQWRPKLASFEKSQFPASAIDQNSFLKTSPCQNGYQCQFLDGKTNSCRVYDNRPFECQLYPFILTKKDNRPALDVHHNCPYVQQNRDKTYFQEHADYLKQFFRRQDMKDFIAQNPSLINDYSSHKDELEHLFSLD